VVTANAVKCGSSCRNTHNCGKPELVEILRRKDANAKELMKIKVVELLDSPFDQLKSWLDSHKSS
jgi:hypothetical protein